MKTLGRRAGILALSLILAMTMLMRWPLPAMAEADAGSETTERTIPEGSAEEQIVSQMNDPTLDAFNGQGKTVRKLKNTSFQSHFDLRDVNGENYVTPVKFQNPFGSCWGFAAISAAEISILGNEEIRGSHTADELDLSEKHLTYFSAKALDDSDNPQNGEGTHAREEMDAADLLNIGGVPFIATSLYSSGIGPNLENRKWDAGTEWLDKCNTLKYQGAGGIVQKKMISGRTTNYCYSPYDNWSLSEEARFKQSFVLAESYILPSPAGYNENDEYEYVEEGTAAIKQQLLEKRGVQIGYHADTFRPGQDTTGGNYISENWAQYTYEQAQANHAVCIIGWDDNYPKDKFKEAHEPPHNGAWLVKNSWGSGQEEFPNKGDGNWGLLEGEDKGPSYKATSDVHTGYFWLSYYDQSIQLPEALRFGSSNEGSSYRLDQHDFMPVNYVNAASVKDEVKMANVFKADVCEKLKAVSCETTFPDTEVTYDIYILDIAAEEPTDGKHMASKTVTYPLGGYHKVELPTPVQIMKNQRYSIVVTQKVPGNEYAVNVPMATNKRYAEIFHANTWEESVINEGESFILMDEKWNDLSDKGLQRELIGKTIEFEEEADILTLDNFPIRGYADETQDLIFYVNGIGNMYLTEGWYDSDGSDMCSLDLVFLGTEDTNVENAEITWELDEGGDRFVEVTDTDNPAHRTVTAKRHGESNMTVTVSGVGTYVIPMFVRLPIPMVEIESGAGMRTLPARISFGDEEYLDDLDGIEFLYRKKGTSEWTETDYSIARDQTIELDGLEPSAEYEARCRSYTVVDGKTYYSYWFPVKHFETAGHTDISGMKVSLSKTEYIFNGKIQKPKVKTIGGKGLTEKKDYTIEWQNPSSKNAGTYKVTVKGIGEYSGKVTATYKIAKAANPMTLKAKVATVKYSKLKKKAQTIKRKKVVAVSQVKGKLLYKYVSAKKGKKSFKKFFKVNAKTGKVTMKKGLKKGTYKVKIKVKAAGNANYKPSAVKTVTFKVKIK